MRVREKGSGTFCRNGPSGASHKRCLTPFPLGGFLFALLAALAAGEGAAPGADMDPAQGFSIALRARFDDVSALGVVACQEDAFLLRLDPEREGGRISFYVFINGSPEPRVSGPRPEPGKWCHIAAGWNGWEATLAVNGVVFSKTRAGKMAPGGGPILVSSEGEPKAPQGAPGAPLRPATSTFGPALRGAVEEFRYSSRPRSIGEMLLSYYGLRSTGAARSRETEFDFSKGLQGWKAFDAQSDARHSAKGGSAGLAHMDLNVPLQDRAFIVLSMSAEQGKEGTIIFATDTGGGVTKFPITAEGGPKAPQGAPGAPLRADGRVREYVLNMGLNSDWTGSLTALCLCPSDAGGVRSLRIVPEGEAAPSLSAEYLLTDTGIVRAGRPERIAASILNMGGTARGVTASLTADPPVRIAAQTLSIPVLAYGKRTELAWEVTRPTPGTSAFTLSLPGNGGEGICRRSSFTFTEPVAVANRPGAGSLRVPPLAELKAAQSAAQPSYVPEPRPVDTGDLLIGAINCPLWEAPHMWKSLDRDRRRVPALGFYDEASPEVKDWEITWARDHGIAFFLYCWYRDGQGGPVAMRFQKGIHEGLFRCRYARHMKFAIMWENAQKGTAGVSSEEDFLQNLLPFWIAEYFRNPSYLVLDGAPLLFIYRPENLVTDLGGPEKAKQALDKARQAVKKAGFAGLTLLGEYRGADPKRLALLRDIGIEYVFPYVIPIADSPAPDRAVAAQVEFWRRTQENAVLPWLTTACMGWTGWHDEGSLWKLPPDSFRTLLQKAQQFREGLPQGSLSRRLLLLDNWNEWGEGHYIMPYREYGFGYLDAVREVFAKGAGAHADLLPRDVGLGPYDAAYRTSMQEEEALRALTEKKMPGPTPPDDSLIAWWSFDEPDGEPVAYDYSGHGRGGVLFGAHRAQGKFGRAIVCGDRGSVIVEPDRALTPRRNFSVECWIRTDNPAQSDKWFLCRIGQGVGYRFGVTQGRLCFALPLAPWSHHVAASQPLPTGRWVHAAATYDGAVIRLYIEGEECGTLERRGPVRDTGAPLCLGSYAKDHKACFTGLLDEVRLYTRTLTAEEIRDRARRSS